MAADQQFCLRWNNHQSTLISVFDTLLENGTLVDCTLAAEGQYLKAHKVVLSACSPYMETLLSQNYDKHPILILKDVKFTELKSMMDYMYRGEVNISQDQLGTFLKAAESLQIKGLSENGEGDARDVGSTNANPPPPRRPPATRPEPEAAQSPAHRSRDGSVSPSSRKRRRLRRNSDDGDNHIESNSCDVPAQSTPVPNIPASITTTPIRTPIVKPEVNDRLDHNTLPAESGLLKEKIEPAEPLLEPKTEYLEDLNNDDSVEDLTLDDDDEMDMSQMSNLSNMSRPGPSHGADLSNQGFPPWQLGNQSGTDEVFMAAQEAVNAHRDSQEEADATSRPDALQPPRFSPRSKKERIGVLCPSCGSITRVAGKIVHKNTCEVVGHSEYICKCGKIFNLKRELQIHSVSCETPLPKRKASYVKCKCGRIFASKTNLLRHIGKCVATQGEEKTYVICKCGKKCLSERGYRTHRKFCNRSPSPDSPPRGSSRASSARTENRGACSTEDEERDTKQIVQKRKVLRKKSFRLSSSSDEEGENSKDQKLADFGTKSDASPPKEYELVGSLETSFSIVEKIRGEKVESRRITTDVVSKSSTPQADKNTPKPQRNSLFFPSYKPSIAFVRPSAEANPTKEELPYEQSSSSTEKIKKEEFLFNEASSSEEPPFVNAGSSKEELPSVQASSSRGKLTKRDLNGRNPSSKNRRTSAIFMCSCEKTFLSKMSLKNHRKVAGCQKPNKCHWCPYQTDSKRSMQDHMVKKHSDSVVQLLDLI